LHEQMTEQNIDNLCNIVENIKEQAKNENLRLTQHGQQEMSKEDIKLSDLFEAIATSEILENYPEHQKRILLLDLWYYKQW